MPVPRDPLLSNDAVLTYRETAKFCPNHVQRESIAIVVTDLRVWKIVLLDWMNSGWNPRNVAGMLKMYSQRDRKFAEKVFPSKLPPLPVGVKTWRCLCGFSVVQNGNGLKDCPEKSCGKTLRADIP